MVLAKVTYLGPTDYQGSRFRVTIYRENGSPGIKIIPYDYSAYKPAQDAAEVATGMEIIQGLICTTGHMFILGEKR